MALARLACPIALALLLSACQPGAQSDGQARKVYRHALDGAPSSLDPAHADNIYAATLVTAIFDTLYRYKYLARPYELTPALAAGFPEISEDGRVYTITLRKDARFADDPAFPGNRGRQVTAEDVVYSLERHFEPETRSRGAWLWRDRIASIRAEGTQRLRIELEAPYPQFTHTLATAFSAVVPHEAVREYGEAFGVAPVGSGPFRLTRFDETMAVLEPNPAFDRGTVDLQAEGFDPARHEAFDLAGIDGRRYPFVDRLEVHFIGEPSARWSSFQSDSGVDVVMVPPELADRVLEQRDPLAFTREIAERYRGLSAPEAGFVFHGFNMANPAIGHHENPERARRNRELRCAMREAFDWKARNRSFYHDLGRVFPGAIPPLLAAFDPALDHSSIEYRPQRARARLAAAGWTKQALPELVYGLESSVHQRQMFEQFRAWMAAAGYPPEKLDARRFGSFGSYFESIGKRELDLFLLGWTLAYPDAQYALQLFYGPNAAPGANSFNYDNPHFDQLFERAAELPDGPQRRRLYRQLNELVIDDCVIIGSLSRTRLFLWKPHVRMLPDRDMTSGFFLRFVDVERGRE